VNECSKCYDKGYYRVGDTDITCWDCCGIVKRAELSRLRAVDEAWRLVRHAAEHCSSNVVIYEVRDQIARLDQLKAPTPTGGE